MTTILVLGSASPDRLAKILDAAIERLALSELAVVGGSEADAMVTEWNARRYRLTRYYPPKPLPAVDVALVFGEVDTEISAGRIIAC